MKNNLSIALNIVLLIAVGVLFYLHFSGNEDKTITSGNVRIIPPKDIKSSKIVFVNLDTLNAKYEYLKDVLASAKAEQQSLEGQYEAQARKLQQEYITFQENMQKGLYTEAEAMTEQNLLMKKKEKMDQLELQQQKLMEKIEGQNATANKNLKKYIEEYNKKSNYTYIISYTDNVPVVLFADSTLDITNEILAGLNMQYEEEKADKKK